MATKVEYIRFKNFERKLNHHLWFTQIVKIFQYMKEESKIQMSLTNKYHKHIACSYGYKLLRVDDTFGKPFKSYLGEVSVYNFINSMIKKIKMLQ